MTVVTYENTKTSSFGLTKLVHSSELIGLYVGIPLALLLVYLLPEGIRAQFFTLYLNHPMILSLLTNAFNHDLASHLVSNLMYYFLVVSAVILVESNVRRFHYAILVIFLVVPIIASAATVAYFSGSSFDQILGFSGIVAGFMGYAVYLLVEKMYQVTPMNKPHAFVMWLSISSLMVLSTAVAIGAVTFYQMGHLSNGVGHLAGYVVGLTIAHIFRAL